MSDKSKSERQGGATDGVSAIPDGDALETSEIDVLLEALADPQRRGILAALAEADDNVAAFSDLIDRVVAREGVSERSRDRVATGLFHRHLPKLADADLVEYDARSETVRYRGGPVAERWLELARSHEAATEN